MLLTCLVFHALCYRIIRQTAASNKREFAMTWLILRYDDMFPLSFLEAMLYVVFYIMLLPLSRCTGGSSYYTG